jgi:hypothetical protein
MIILAAPSATAAGNSAAVLQQVNKELRIKIMILKAQIIT